MAAIIRGHSKKPAVAKKCILGCNRTQCQHVCKCKSMCPCHKQTSSCNATNESLKNASLYKDDQCFPSMFGAGKENTHSEAQNFLTERTWMTITAFLCLLLAVSLACSLRQLSCHTKKKCKNGNYTYHRLEDMTNNVPSEDICKPLTEYQADVVDCNAVVSQYHA